MMTILAYYWTHLTLWATARSFFFFFLDSIDILTYVSDSEIGKAKRQRSDSRGDFQRYYAFVLLPRGSLRVPLSPSWVPVNDRHDRWLPRIPWENSLQRPWNNSSITWALVTCNGYEENLQQASSAKLQQIRNRRQNSSTIRNISRLILM